MAKETIKNVRDLPSWFVLTKYDGTKTLDAAGWYEQLKVRSEILWYLIYERETESELYETALNKIYETPIVDVMSNFELNLLFADGNINEFRSKSIRYSLGVQMTTVRQHYQTEHNIEIEKRNYARDFFKDVFEFDADDMLADLELRYPYQDWLDEPIDNNQSEPHNYFVNIRVNMALPYKVLINQFESLIAGLSSELDERGVSIRSKIRLDFESWNKFAILPYLDLLIWSMSEGKKIPNRVVADAIFRLGEGGEEVVRKTTQKLASLVLTDSHLQFLASIAAQEIVERN